MASDNDRAAIRKAYSDFLGREASASEVEGWVSGRFHGGGINDWLNAISQSGEAKENQRKLERDAEIQAQAARDQAARDQAARDQANRNQSNRTQTMGDMIDNDFTGDAPEYQPEPPSPPLPPPRPLNTPRPPSTVASGTMFNQGGNSYVTASQQIQDAYREHLGRDATPQEIANHLSGGRYFAPVNVRHAIRNIRNSQDARDYRNPPETVVTDDPEKGRAKEEMQAAYREHLDRDMSDEEFEAWWDGTNEWGPEGIEGLPGWLRGVAHEGNRLKAAAAGPGTGTTVAPPRIGQAPPGYDQRKWDDPEHGTAKYDTAAFLQGLTKPSEIAAMVRSPEFQARFPGATFNGKDKIDFGSYREGGNRIGVIDVLMRADQGTDTSGGLWWGAGGGTAPTPGGPLDTGPDLTQGITDEDNPLSAPDLTQPPDTLMGPRGGGMMGPGGGGGSMGPGGGGGTMGQMITPYNPLATYSPTPYTPPPPFRPPAYQGATPFGQDPYAAADPFTGPTATDMTADPGYQFRLQQGQEALERSGAALGVTNTGGTLKDILDYGQRAAAQEYGNVFGRQRDVYDLNERNRFNAYEANWGNAMDAYRENERNRAGAFDTNVMNARDAYEMNERNRYQGYTTNEVARWGQNLEAENRRSGAYTTNLGAYERQQTQGLRAQGQGFDQSFRNWQEQYNQQRLNQTTAFNQRFQLRGVQ
jgi:hypothetical protein